MVVAEVQVAKTTCETTHLVPIPKGIVGATVSIKYMDSAWDGLQKTVVFQGEEIRDVLDVDGVVTIPPEVVSKSGGHLRMGVYGVDAQNHVIIPSLWVDLGVIRTATTPSGDTSIDPSLPVWAQIQGMIGNLDDLDTDAKSNLVAAVNEALTKGGGEVDPVAVQKIVEDYLKANPPSPVKAGNGLSMAEDGTLSVDTANKAEKDNTKPITSAGVYTEIGNINALLATI